MTDGQERYVPSVPTPPPPRDERGYRWLLGAFVVACVVAVLFGGLALVALMQSAGPRAVFPTRSASPSPSTEVSATPSPSHRPRIDGAFRFLDREGGVPVRWDPCQTITFAANTVGARPGALVDLREALRRVTDATGIPFRYVGRTRESFLHAYNRMRFRGVEGRAELIVIWLRDAPYEDLREQLHDRRPSIAFAKTMAGVIHDRDEYSGGIIVMNADATAAQGFNYRYSHGAVLLHELGHIMGLDHVKDRDQLMYTGRHPNYFLRDYGAGDLEGLRRVGREAGCLD